MKIETQDATTADKERDEGWVRVMAGVVLKCKPGDVDEKLVEMWAGSLDTARRQAGEGIGDIRVKPVIEGREQKLHYEVYVGGERAIYRCDCPDMGLLVGLGYKYLGMNDCAKFAQLVGRMLKVESEWAK